MKRFLIVALAVAMICSLSVATAVSTSAADISEDGLIGWYKLDGDFTNSADSTGDTDGVVYSNAGGSSAFDDEFWYDYEREWATAGVDGSCYVTLGQEGFATLNPGNNDFTISFWMALEDCDSVYCTPYVWYGEQNQSTGYFGGECWIGMWASAVYTGGGGWGLNTAPGVSSNDTAGSRVGYNAADITLFEADDEALDYGFDMPWTMVTISCVLDADTNTYTISYYLNGEAVVDYTTGETSVSGFPNPYTGDAETYGDYIYFQVNYWDSGVAGIFYDDILIYNRALSADEVASTYSAYTVPSVEGLRDSVYTAEEQNAETTEATETEEVTTADEGTSEEVTTAGEGTEADATGTSEAVTTGDAEETSSGCGSALGAAAVIVAVTAVFGCAVVKKH